MIPRFRLRIASSALESISKVLKSGYLTNGPVTRAFEAQFARYVKVKHAVGTVNGTASLHLALLALGVRSGTEVILPAFTYHAAASAVLYCNAKPVLVDVDPQTLCIDPDMIPKAISKRTRAVIATHFAGHPCDMKRLLEVAEQNGISVIEDAAHALGTTYRGRPVGSLGNVCCFSFYPTKPLTTGEGGMIATSDAEIANKCRTRRGLAAEPRRWLQYDVRTLGFTYRMSELNAALGIHQLRMVDRNNSTVRKKASSLKRMLEGTGLILPHEASYAKHIYNLFVVQVVPRKFGGVTRDALARALRRKGIETQLHFVPIHRLNFFAKHCRLAGRTLPVSDYLWRTVLSLPMYPTISFGELRRIRDAIIACRGR